MKKLFIFIIATLLTFFSYSQKDYTISYHQPQSGVYDITFEINHWEMDEVTYAQTTYQKLHFSSSAYTQEKGWAELPSISASLQLPADKNVTLNIKDIQYQYDTLNLPLLPSRGVIYRNQDPKSIPYTIAPASLVNSYYPAEAVTMEEPFIVRDVRGTSVHLYPFQYNAVTHVLRIATKVTVELVENTTPATNPLINDNPHPVKDAIGMYQSLFLNYQPTRDALATGEIGDILVITTADYESGIEPYIQWKKEMGYNVSKEVVSRGTNVVSLIKNQYLANNNLLYVQLVGDWADIKSDASVDSSPTDPKMGCVAGNDNFPDIAIGRFSCSSLSQLTVQVDKTINYEKDPDMSADWRESFIGIGSDEGQGTGDDSEVDYLHIQRIYTERLANFTYNTHLQNYAPNESVTTLKNHINQGASAIAYCGHGDVTYWVTTNFSTSHISQLTNAAKLPFIVSVACLNGAFHNSSDCFAEAWLKKENGGAVVTLMSSISQAWTPPQRGQDYFFDILCGGFNYDLYSGQSGINTTEQRTRWGSIVINSFNLMLTESNTTDDRETMQTWGTFGDASLQLRTQQPVTITSSNMAITSGIPFETVITANNSPVKDALVCISQNDTYYSALTDSHGRVNIPHNFMNGEILLVVTAFNKTTIYETIHCTPSNVPYLVLDSYTPDRIVSGENSYLSLTVKNLGGANTSGNVHVSLSCNDTQLTFIDNSEDGSALAGNGGTASFPYAFQVAIPQDVPTGYHFIVDVMMSSGGDTWYGTLQLTALGGDCVTPVGIHVLNDNHSATISWDDNSTVETITISDDAEAHTAFTINSPGSVGWSYIDGDDANTGEFRNISYTNEGAKMAYIIMNPEEATGMESVSAHSGTQFWACPYATGGWFSSVSNDDYIVSPQLHFTQPFTLSFYARSFSSSYADEKFYVEYSISGNNAGDFSPVNSSVVTTNTSWREYSYTIPAEAKYVAIHCVSNNQYMLCIDDILLSGTVIDGYTYNVYRNDELIAENVIGGSFTDDTDQDGNYCYTVTANCPNRYESIPTDYACTSVSVEDNNSTMNSLNVYPNPASHAITIEGNHLQHVDIYNMTGQLVHACSVNDATLQINVDGFAEGIYFIKAIDQKQQVHIRKVIIQH